MLMGCTGRLDLESRKTLSVIWKKSFKISTKRTFLEKLSHFIIYNPQHTFQFEAHRCSLYESISYSARHGRIPLHNRSNQSCQQRNPFSSRDSTFFIVLQGRNYILFSFEALSQFNCVLNSLTCSLA